MLVEDGVIALAWWQRSYGRRWLMARLQQLQLLNVAFFFTSGSDSVRPS
jgi:hypothetical protein